MLNATTSAEQSFVPVPHNLTSIEQYVLVRAIPWFTVFTIFATLVLNGLIVIVYFRRPSLRTPFNAYITNIVITEIATALMAMPSSFIRSFYNRWPYDAVSCSFSVYAQQILGAGVRYGHVLVTLNRIWAVTSPISYRTKHTDRFAKWLIVGTWVYLHVLNLPVLFRGRWVMGSAPTDPACRVNVTSQYGSAITTEVIGYDLPEIFIVVSYPYIWYRLRQLQRKSANRVKPVIFSTGQGTLTLPIPGGSAAVTHDPVHHISPKQQAAKIFRSHNRVLAYFVVGILVCWTPNHVYFLLVDTNSLRTWDATFYMAQYLMQYMYSWVNPILCYMAMRQLREAINDLILCRIRVT